MSGEENQGMNFCKSGSSIRISYKLFHYYDRNYFLVNGNGGPNAVEGQSKIIRQGKMRFTFDTNGNYKLEYIHRGYGYKILEDRRTFNSFTIQFPN